MRDRETATILLAAALVAGCSGASTHAEVPAHRPSSTQPTESVAQPKVEVEAPVHQIQNFVSSCLDASVTAGSDKSEATLTISSNQSVGECGCKSALVRYALVTAVGGEVLDEGEINTLRMVDNSASVMLKLSSAGGHTPTLTLGCSNSL
jgi:hypothetical protein